MKVLVLEPYLYDTAPGQRFRIEQWARLMEKQGASFTFSSFASPELQAIMYRSGLALRKSREVFRAVLRRWRLLASVDGVDVVFLFREAAPVGPPFLERLLARRRLPVVYDFDDAIYLPNASDSNRLFALLKNPGKTRAICAMSSHVTVGNARLAEFARGHAPKVSIVPTTIDVERYLPRPPRRDGDRVVVGWMGSQTTVAHLLALTPALQKLAARRHFVLHVVSPARVSIEGLEVRWSPWGVDSEVRNLHRFDIGIMPLPDDPWARGKCGAKLLQYMGVGVPGVASPVGVNTEIIRDEVNGFLANTLDDWVDRLSALIDSPALRERLGSAGRRTVEERYSAQGHAPAVLRVLRESAASKGA